MENIKSAKMLNDQIKKIENYKTEYSDFKEKLDNEFSTGRIKTDIYNSELSQKKNEISNLLIEFSNETLAMIDKEKAEALELLESKREIPNAEDTTLLSFLSSVKELEQRDLLRYQEMYKNNPIALKKLQEIAISKKIVLSEVEDETEVTESIFSYLEMMAKTFSDKTGFIFDEIGSATFNSFKDNFSKVIDEKGNKLSSILGIELYKEKTVSVEEVTESVPATFEDRLRSLIKEYPNISPKK